MLLRDLGTVPGSLPSLLPVAHKTLELVSESDRVFFSSLIPAVFLSTPSFSSAFFPTLL